jgi:hypothetical protein
MKVIPGEVRCSSWYPPHPCRLYHTNTGLESGGLSDPREGRVDPLWWEPCPLKGVQQERCRNCCGTRDTKARVKNWRQKKRNEKCRKVLCRFLSQKFEKITHTHTHTHSLLAVSRRDDRWDRSSRRILDRSSVRFLTLPRIDLIYISSGIGFRKIGHKRHNTAHQTCRVCV